MVSDEQYVMSDLSEKDAKFLEGALAAIDLKDHRAIIRSAPDLDFATRIRARKYGRQYMPQPGARSATTKAKRAAAASVKQLTANAPASLSTLPPELENQVQSYINRPADLANLCQVNKRFQSFMTAKLYHAVTLDIGETVPMAMIECFVNPGNKGLQYIRHLKLVSKEPRHATAHSEQAMTMLVECLPPQTLTTCRVELEVPNQGLHLTNLRAKHGALGNEMMVGDYYDVLLNLPSPATTLLTVNASKMIEISQTMKHRVPWPLFTNNVRILELRFDPAANCQETYNVLDNLVTFRQRHPSETQAAATTQNLSAGVIVYKCPKLESLNMQRCSFGCNSPSIVNDTLQSTLRVMNLETLKTLILHDCAHCAFLLLAIAADQRPKCLRKLVVMSRDESRQQMQPFFYRTVDQLLTSFTGLQHLAISVDAPLTIGMPALAKHTSTLKSLYLERPGLDDPYHSLDVKLLCERCMKLEQIALPLPKAEVTKLMQWSGIWKPATVCEPYETKLAHFRQLRHLKTVRILSFPFQDFDSANRGQQSVAVNLQTLATKIFNMCRPHGVPRNNLSVIAFGSNDNASAEPNHKLRCYLRTMELNADGQDKLFARGQTVLFVRHEELASDILEIERTAYGFLRTGSEY